MSREEIEGTYRSIIDEIERNSPEPNTDGMTQRQYDEYSLGWYVECAARAQEVHPCNALDVGAMWGTNSVFLHKLGFDVTTLDIRDLVPPAVRMDHYLTRRVMDLENPADYHWTGTPIGLVWMSEVLEHLNFNPLTPLAWIASQMRYDGRLILTTPDAEHYPDVPDGPTKRTCPWWKIPCFDRDRDLYREHDRHSKQYDQLELHDLLQTVGFRIDESTRIGSQGVHLLVVARRV